MLPSSFVVFTAALLAPLVAATNLVCTPSVNGYGINSAATKVQDFCGTAFRSNTTLLEKSYGVPYMTFRFSKQGSCDSSDCISAYTGLFTGCEYCQVAADEQGKLGTNRDIIGQYNNKTIWGTAQIMTSCATYNYTIGNVTSPFLTPNKTLASGASITPSPTGDANGMTAGLGKSDATLTKARGSLVLGVASIFLLLM